MHSALRSRKAVLAAAGAGLLLLALLLKWLWGDSPEFVEPWIGPPRVDPAQALSLTVEAPRQPLWVHGAIFLKLWITNRSDQQIVICRPLDGSTDLGRDPEYEVTLTDPSGGRVMPRESFRRCGTMNRLRSDDFIRLKPGEKANVFLPGVFEVPYAGQYGVGKGKYLVRIRYRMRGDGRADGYWPGAEDHGAVRLLREAFRCDLTSDPVAVEFTDEPSTVHDCEHFVALSQRALEGPLQTFLRGSPTPGCRSELRRALAEFRALFSHKREEVRTAARKALGDLRRKLSSLRDAARGVPPDPSDRDAAKELAELEKSAEELSTMAEP
jgi:hypothetical protein